MSDSSTTRGVSPQSVTQALGFEPDDFVTIATNKVQQARTVSAEDLDMEASFGDLEQADTWIGAQPVKPGTPNKRTKASDVSAIRVLYADFDLKDATNVEQISSAIEYLSEILETDPWSIVESGGGIHPRWKLEKPLDTADGADLLKHRWKATVLRVAEECGFKADSVFDLPRVLRLPGTVNEKYTPARPVFFAEADMAGAVTNRALWANLDTPKRKLTAQAVADPKAKPDGDLEPAPAKPEQSADVLPERYVNSEINKDILALKDLQDQGWDGPAWHNTVRDIAYRLAKIGASPNTTITLQQVADMFYAAAPTDDDFGFDEHHELWESGLERAEGEIYELVGSGDDIYSDDFDDMIAEANKSAQPKADIDPSLSLDDLDEPAEEPAPVAGFRERYDALTLPLLPGLSGANALRILPVDGATPLQLVTKIQVLGENVSDLHADEHADYLHPHCPICFPDTWQGQLHRHLVANRNYNPADVRPPAGTTAPHEGYVVGNDLLTMEASNMLVEGVLPFDSIGVVRGRGGAGKTFIVLDLVMSILDETRDRWKLTEGTGLELDEDEDTPTGTVGSHGSAMFLAGEGFEAMTLRIKAWLAHHGYGTTPDTVPSWFTNITARPEVPNMFSGGAAFDALLERVATEQPKVIVVDTLQKAAAGSDQNSSSDMAQVYLRLAQLKKASNGGIVIVIAHSTKDDSSTRGASSIEDDADFVLHISADENGGAKHGVEVVKLRDGQPAEPMDFYLTPIGKSVVVTATEPDGAVSTDQPTIEVMTAMWTLHSITSFDEPVTRADIVKQSGLPQAQAVGILSDLVYGNYVASEGGNKYSLTPHGKSWVENKSATLFAKSRGLK